MNRFAKRTFGLGGGILVMLFGSWFAPPVYHRLMNWCPARPGGVRQAQAVPAYARKYGISCSQCHAAFPVLNEYGREFKLNGYVREKGNKEGVLETKDESLWTEKHFPWGAIVKARPYDKKQTDEEFKLRALHELELFVAGGDAARNVSYLTEVEAEDETGFAPELGELQLGYHPWRTLNVLLAKRSFFAMDPYQTLSNAGKLTRSSRDFATKGHSSGDTLDTPKQTIALYGEVGREKVGSVYYAAGVSADKSDDEGEGAKDASFRLAFDSLRGFVLGGFAEIGSQSAGVAGKKKFSRAGADALLELFGVTARSVFTHYYDKDTVTNAPENNRAAYGELFYVVKKEDRPLLVPLIRQDWFETTNGTKHFGNFTAQLSHYFTENARGFIEYFANTKTHGTAKDHRWTAQVEVGF